MYFGQPVVNLREFPPDSDEAIPHIKMGDGEAPVAEEFKYRDLGSILSRNFDDSASVTTGITARIRLARIAFTKLQEAIFGTRRVALESKKIAYESLARALAAFVWLGAVWQLKPHCRPSEVANGPFRGCDESRAAQPAFSRGSRR
jgi:hypothetical protein